MIRACGWSLGAAAATALLIAATPPAPDAPPAPKRLAVVDSLKAPEAVSYDAAQDAYFVSNMNGRNGNGFITRIRGRDGVVDSLHFIQGLKGPMGSRIKGDTLWVVDIDALRGFNARTGALLATVDLSPLNPLFINDVAIGPDDDFYITDTGVDKGKHTGPDRIYHIGRDRRATIALETPALTAPDGIDWDPRGRRLVLAPFGGPAVQEWRPGSAAPMDIAPGKGKFDGIEIEPDGRILITSWNDSSVSTLEGNTLVRRISGLPAPADVSLDAGRQQVGIVSLMANRFELWTLPR